MDAACPGSLEISGHCLAAARVIALLLVGPAKRGTKDKRQYEKKERKRDTEHKILDFPEADSRGNSHFQGQNSHLWVKNLSNIKCYFPQHILTWLTLRWRYVLVTIHRAVIKDKYSLSRAPLKKRVEGVVGWKKDRASVELTCLVCAQLKYPLLSANYHQICIFIISIWSRGSTMWSVPGSCN